MLDRSCQLVARLPDAVPHRIPPQPRTARTLPETPLDQNRSFRVRDHSRLYLDDAVGVLQPCKHRIGLVQVYLGAALGELGEREGRAE
jgi:hypothetical protein